MNKLKSLFLFMMLLAGFTACSDSDENLQVTLSAREVKFDANGGNAKFTVQANGEWNITTDGQTWYSVTPLSGNGSAEVTVTAEAFEAAAGRSALLTIHCGNSTATLAVTQTYLVNPDDPANQSFTIRAKGGDQEILLPESDGYEVSIPADAQWVSVKEKKDDSVILSFAVNGSAEYRNADVIVNKTDGSKLATLKIKQSWRNIEPGELLIEEIFCTGNIITSTGKPDKVYGDQYFRLTNNTDETLFIDGTIIAESYMNTSSTATFNETYNPDIRPESAPVQALYVIPGDGSQYPLEAHQSVIIANNAQNHKATNPNSFDLSKADFEWYNESTVASMQDIDNPDVPNLDIWEANTASIWILASTGVRGYLIAQLPSSVSKEQFMTDEAYIWSATKTWSNAAGREFSTTVKNIHVIPNDWVLDGVALGTKEDYKLPPFDSSIDAGYTYCSLNSSDTNRYGKGVRRKSAESKLVDTNNSTNDFEAYTTVSMAQ